MQTPTAPVPTTKTAGALRGFFRIADAWHLGRAERATLLATSERAIDRWRADIAAAELTRDQVERLPYVIGIYSGLHAIFGPSRMADDWLHQLNEDFGGAAPLVRMLAGNIGDLVNVLRYVDAWRVG